MSHPLHPKTMEMPLGHIQSRTAPWGVVPWPVSGPDSPYARPATCSVRWRTVGRGPFRVCAVANSAEFLVAWATAQNQLIEMPTLGWHCDRAKARSVRLAFYFIHLFTPGEFTMTQTNEASTLHKKAASEHEAAAKHHHKAAECHDHNKTGDAKISSKSAMDCCNTAQKHTKAACDCSDK